MSEPTGAGQDAVVEAVQTVEAAEEVTPAGRTPCEQDEAQPAVPVRDSVRSLWAPEWDLLPDPGWHAEPRDTPPDVTLPVLVGVDGSPGAAHALEWALREAEAQGAPVRAVTAWSWDARMVRAVGGRGVRQAERMRQVQEDQLGLVLRRVGRTTCRIDTVLAEGDPASLLLDHSRTARLLVVGSHAHLGRSAPGSVARACMRFARCPVVVVPAPAVA